MGNRVLRESITTSEQINRLDEAGEVFFYRLLVVVDDFGLFDARPAILKARCFPLRHDLSIAQVAARLASLTDAGLVEVYEVDGRPYLSIIQWAKHQRIRNAKSSFPLPPTPGSPPPPSDRDSPSIDRDPPTDASEPPTNVSQSRLAHASPRASAVVLSPLEPVGKNSTTKKDLSVAVTAVFDHWRQVMGHPHARLDDDRRKKIAARLDQGYTVEQLQQAITGCRRSAWHMGENDRRRRFDDIELICRDAKRVDQFIAEATAPARTLSVVGERTAENLRRWLEKEGEENHGTG